VPWMFRCCAWCPFVRAIWLLARLVFARFHISGCSGASVLALATCRGKWRAAIVAPLRHLGCGVPCAACFKVKALRSV
jgi:hypothetical protein